MNETETRLDQPPQWIRKVARIWSLPIIAFVLIFTIGTIWSEVTNAPPDPYAVEDISFVESLQPVLIGISGLGLALAWRWEKLGGIFSLVFSAALVLTLLITRPFTDNVVRSLIPYLLAVIVIIPGILFVLYGVRSTPQQDP